MLIQQQLWCMVPLSLFCALLTVDKVSNRSLAGHSSCFLGRIQSEAPQWIAPSPCSLAEGQNLLKETETWPGKCFQDPSSGGYHPPSWEPFLWSTGWPTNHCPGLLISCPKIPYTNHSFVQFQGVLQDDEKQAFAIPWLAWGSDQERGSCPIWTPLHSTRSIVQETALTRHDDSGAKLLQEKAWGSVQCHKVWSEGELEVI